MATNLRNENAVLQKFPMNSHMIYFLNLLFNIFYDPQLIQPVLSRMRQQFRDSSTGSGKRAGNFHEYRA